MGWQPIETIPDDEELRVLVYDPANGVFEAKASKDGHYYDPVYWEWDGNGVTHWMPLPEPPDLTIPTTEEIDARARELFKECGGLDMEWEAVDECVRSHYRAMASRVIRNAQSDGNS